ncbi:hypothetical protein SXCC_00371 [Gluconacetobacter sp. SXCC-1]|nr:hypothetical protein SXCC_00371 [Gluconacetobacter sp. SXCC-1]
METGCTPRALRTTAPLRVFAARRRDFVVKEDAVARGMAYLLPYSSHFR